MQHWRHRSQPEEEEEEAEAEVAAIKANAGRLTGPRSSVTSAGSMVTDGGDAHKAKAARVQRHHQVTRPSEDAEMSSR